MNAHLGINLDQIDGLDVQAWFSLIVLGLNEGEWVADQMSSENNVHVHPVCGGHIL